MAGKQASLSQGEACALTLGLRKWIINVRDVATIVPSPGDYVWGTVLLLHAHDEQRLDRSEGLKYVKSILAVHLDGVTRNPGAVLTYIDKDKTPKVGKLAADHKYHEKLVKARADGEKKSIPKEYFDKYWKPFLAY
jgi:gamma-glutamylcyclotransferase